jgi:hypothetical protein
LLFMKLSAMNIQILTVQTLHQCYKAFPPSITNVTQNKLKCLSWFS